MSGTSNIHLQPRDTALLRELYESRVMTIRQAGALHFDGSYEAARKRLAKLKTAGFITLRARPVCEEAAVFFTRRAYCLLRDGGHLANYPPLRHASLEKRSQVSELTLRHELAVMDAKCAFVRALREHDDLSLLESSTWPRLSQFKAERSFPKPGESAMVLVKPDGFLRIQEQEADGGLSEVYCYLEVDRGTETVETLVSRCQAYRDHYRRGGLPERFGHPRGEWEQWPFRVLWTFKSLERLCNAAEALCLAHPPILGQAWLATFDDATADPLGAIWLRPQDYRRALEGTPFNPTLLPHRAHHSGDNGGGHDVYKRQPERERLVSERGERHALLG
jgi:hypothetical protein